MESGRAMFFRRRPRRWGRMAVILIVVTLAGAGARAIWANGLFAHTPVGFAGSCQTLAHLPGISDIEQSGGAVFLAVAGARGPQDGDGIYVLMPGQNQPVRLKGAPKDFHPRGISLYPSPDDKGLFLMAVNRRARVPAETGSAAAGSHRYSIDTFEVTDPKGHPALVAQGTIMGGLLTDPQDVAAAGPGTFYVTNRTVSDNGLLNALRRYGVLAGSEILYFNGMAFQVVAEGLYGADGLALTPDGQHLLVAGQLSRDLKSFSRESFSGTLTDENKALSLPAGPARISFDARGDLWAGAHANLSRLRAFAADAKRPAPSQVLRISVADGAGISAATVYGNDGRPLGGADSAVPAGGRLLIGGALDGALLACTPG